MKAYLSEPYNGIQITFDSSLLGGVSCQFSIQSDLLLYGGLFLVLGIQEIQGPPGIQASTALEEIIAFWKCCGSLFPK